MLLIIPTIVYNCKGGCDDEDDDDETSVEFTTQAMTTIIEIMKIRPSHMQSFQWVTLSTNHNAPHDSPSKVIGQVLIQSMAINPHDMSQAQL